MGKACTTKHNNDYTDLEAKVSPRSFLFSYASEKTNFYSGGTTLVQKTDQDYQQEINWTIIPKR